MSDGSVDNLAAAMSRRFKDHKMQHGSDDQQTVETDDHDNPQDEITEGDVEEHVKKDASAICTLFTKKKTAQAEATEADESGSGLLADYDD